MEIQIDHLYTIPQLEVLFNELLAGDFADAYPYYDLWRSQTREDLLLGRKVAIAVWTVPDEYTGRREDLAGACILRKSETLLGPELELEVIHVESKYRNPHYYPNSFRPGKAIGSSLLRKTEELCQKYGYRRIVTEIPTRFSNMVLFLLHQQFVIHGYDANQRQYRLLKYVEPIYNKDPYDVNMVVEWLCNRWLITINEWVNPDHALGLHTIGEHARCEIEVDILICQDSADFRQKVKKADRPIRLVFFKTEEDHIPDALKERTTHFIQPTMLRRETRNRNVDLTLQDYATAVLVSIRKELFDRFKSLEPQAFLDGGEYGQILMKRVQGESRRHAFIVFCNSDVNNQEILGVGTVSSVHIGPPEELWDRFGTMSTFGQKSEFDRYSNIKTRMTAIVLDQLEVNSERVDFSKRLSEGGWCYLSDEEFYRQVLAHGDYPQTLRLVKG